MRFAMLCLVAAVIPCVSRSQAPVFKITPEESKINFSVKASVALEAKFEKWDATLTFPSTDVTTGVMDIKIQADSVRSGSGMKDGKLKSKDFFNGPRMIPTSLSTRTRLCRPVPTRLTSREHLRYGE